MRSKSRLGRLNTGDVYAGAGWIGGSMKNAIIIAANPTITDSKVMSALSDQLTRSVIVRPHSQDTNNPFAWENLINKAVLNVDPT